MKHTELQPGTPEYEAYWRDHPSEWRLLSPSEAARVFKREIQAIADKRAQESSGPSSGIEGDPSD